MQRLNINITLSEFVLCGEDRNVKEKGCGEMSQGNVKVEQYTVLTIHNQKREKQPVIS